MRRTLAYSIDKIEPYINWDYFYHAWGIAGKSGAAQDRTRLHREAVETLHGMYGRYQARVTYYVKRAMSSGDDIMLGVGSDYLRLPMLRQQHPDPSDGLFHSLADYVLPQYQRGTDRIGVFAATVDEAMVSDAGEDMYRRMMAQTLADRLVEAAAEKAHQYLRHCYWGYDRHETLTIADMLAGRYQGIRPAVGYPSMPDMSLLFLLSPLLDMPSMGIRLTESAMMQPHASVAGLIIAHPKARYFDIGRIGEDQLQDYARRRGLPVETMRRFLQANL